MTPTSTFLPSASLIEQPSSPRVRIGGHDVDRFYFRSLLIQPMPQRQRRAVSAISPAHPRGHHLDDRARNSFRFESSGAETGRGIVIVGVAAHASDRPAGREDLAVATGSELSSRRVDSVEGNPTFYYQHIRLHAFRDGKERIDRKSHDDCPQEPA